MGDRLLRRFREYAGSEEVCAVLLVKRHLTQAESHWVDVVNCRRYEMSSDPMHFRFVVGGLFKRTIRPKYPPRSTYTAGAVGVAAIGGVRDGEVGLDARQSGRRQRNSRLGPARSDSSRAGGCGVCAADHGRIGRAGRGGQAGRQVILSTIRANAPTVRQDLGRSSHPARTLAGRLRPAVWYPSFPSRHRASGPPPGALLYVPMTSFDVATECARWKRQRALVRFSAMKIRRDGDIL